MPSSSSFLSPQHTLMPPAVAAINHLLAQEAWARESLALHAGKEACIDTVHFQLRVRVARDGMIETASSESPANVTIRIKLADLPLILQDRDRAFSYVKIEGDAEFANTLSQLAKGLRWEAEHDLERFLGPIGASRIVGSARGAVAGAANAGRRLAENLAEYLLEERNVLVRPSLVDDFAAEVARLRDDVERSAKRIAKLELRLAQDAAARPIQPSGNRTLDS